MNPNDECTPAAWRIAAALPTAPIPSSLELDGMRDPFAECEISCDILEVLYEQWT